MSEVRDPAIKLFGRDIPVDPIQNNDSQCENLLVPEAMFDSQLLNEHEEFRRTEVNTTHVDASRKQKHSTLKVEARVNHRRKDDKATKRDMDHQEKILKKPDKVLPCPRCNSLETKFCYFNNYNVNQPRHFCKNCQRYWTAGGTIRNVPVGAGKRKNKHLAFQCSEVAVAPDAVSVTHADSNPASHMQFSSSGFPAASELVGGMGNTPSSRKDASLCESLDTVLNLNGQKKIEMVSSAIGDDGEDPSSSSSRVSVSREKECSENGVQQVDLPQDYNGFSHLHPLPYYPVPPWGCQWSRCWNPMVFRPSSNITPNPAYMGSATMMAVPRFSAPTIDVPVAPSSYLGCLPSWITEKEEFFTGIPSPSSPATSSGGSGNRSPTLGKHSRDANAQSEDTTKQYLWVPKTLRINDPKEAAKSSIWSTLETKSEQNKPIMKGGVFKSFEPKSDSSSQDSPVLRANPAALSRSESFQEKI